jgi:hypothetical protein
MFAAVTLRGLSDIAATTKENIFDLVLFIDLLYRLYKIFRKNSLNDYKVLDFLLF